MGRTGQGLVVLAALSISACEENEPTRAVQISANMASTCALDEKGGLRCWGENFNEEGILGYGMKEHVGDDEVPADLGDIEMGGPVRVVDVGPRRACALREDDAICWGSRVGEDTQNIGDDEAPEVTQPLGWLAGQKLRDVGVGFMLRCVLSNQGGVECSAGRVQLGGVARQLAVGGDHACAVLEDGGIRCWGDNFGGGLGHPGIWKIGVDEVASYGDVDVGGPAKQVVAGDQHTCALLKSGDVRCWGINWNAWLGYGSNVDVEECPSNGHGPSCSAPQCCIGDDEPPSAMPPLDLGEGRVVSLAASNWHTCALMEAGTVRCWGWNELGQLGYGTRESIGDDEPAGAMGDVPLDEPVVEIAPGYRHTCALLGSGAVRCWGYNGTRGYLGQGYSTLGCVDEELFAGCPKPECCIGDDEPITSIPPVPLYESAEAPPFDSDPQ